MAKEKWRIKNVSEIAGHVLMDSDPVVDVFGKELPLRLKLLVAGLCFREKSNPCGGVLMRISTIICAGLLFAVGTPGIIGQRVAAPVRTQSQGPHLIGSLTAAERKQLPASTQVKLPSGKIATLGTLRAQHELHMRAFAAAAGLGRALAEKLSRQSPVPGQSAGKLSGPPLITSGTSRAGTTRASVTQPPPNPAIQPQAMRLISRVPFQPPPGVAKDYLDFCNAAQATVCAYLPDGCGWHMDDSLTPGGTTGATDCFDYMITDADVCIHNGGRMLQTDPVSGAAVCMFKYPTFQRKFFNPTGAAFIGSCDSRYNYYDFDPKGEVRVDITGNLDEDGILPGSCVVQVWLTH